MITDKAKKLRSAVVFGSVAVAVLAIAVVLIFGHVGRYAYADKYCEVNAAAALEAISDVPDSYRDASQLKEYLTALVAYENKDYDTAESIFEELDYYRNSRIVIKKMYYDKAVSLRDSGDYTAALEYFEKSNSEDGEIQILATKYELAEALYDTESFAEAEDAFLELGDYSDSEHRYLESKLRYAQSLSETGNHTEAVLNAEEILAHEKGAEFAPDAARIIFALAEVLMEEENWTTAIEQLEKCDAYPEEGVIEEKTKYCSSMITYEDAVKHMEEERYAEAVELFDTIPGFLDADELNLQCEQKAFSWDFSGFLSKDGTAAKKTTTFVRADTIYFYGTLSGGKPGKNVDLLFVWVDCAGRSVNCRVEDWTDGSSGGVTFAYSNPKNANFGKSTITVYVDETGEQLAKYNFTINK